MSAIDKLLAPLKRGLQQMLRVSTLIKVDDTASIQMVQIETLSGEIIEVPRIQNFGHSSVPLKGAKGVVAAIGGKTNGYVCVAMDDVNTRVTGLKDGESISYDAFGQYMHFKEDGRIEQKANNEVTVIVPKYRIEGDLEVTGEILDRADTNTKTMSDMRSIYDDHDHTGDSGGTTSKPNQVMS
jgi:phage baseplate assembly protein V